MPARIPISITMAHDDQTRRLPCRQPPVKNDGMAILWLGGAILLTVVSGFLVSEESTIIAGLPLAVGGAACYVVAAVWAVHGPAEKQRRWVWTVATTGRTMLGLAVAVLAFGFSVSFIDRDRVTLSERMTAEITDTRVCEQAGPGCQDRYRLSADGEDLGWTYLCDSPGPQEAGGPVGTQIEIVAEPLGRIPPQAASCTGGWNPASWVTPLWLGGVGAIAVLIAIGSRWRAVAGDAAGRDQSLPAARRRGD
ncbi:hypothetical protein ACN27F_13740 [Solwaraspora sp. WMMB335]|uniref:hypothetical protein n=1 Tax=Solwaraspora sp. WMMB335 TaxID=3404118 RepID=UPI003B955E21